MVGRPGSLFVVVVASSLAQDAATPRVAPQDEIVAGTPRSVRLAAEDPELEGHGPSRTLRFVADADGSIFLSATAVDPGVDPFLRVVDARGAIVAEDDNSGGGSSAYVRRHVHAGDEWRIV